MDRLIDYIEKWMTPQEVKKVNQFEVNSQNTAREIYDPTKLTFGHATGSQENAQQILDHGLYVAHLPFSSYTVEEFINPNIPFKNQQDEIIKLIQKWPHKGSQLSHLIIIQIPQPIVPESIAINADPVDRWHKTSELNRPYIESFLKKLDHYILLPGVDEEMNYILPNQYIRGYINTRTGLLTSNPKFGNLNM